MLDTSSVIISFIVLSILSFPVGYFTVNIFQNRHISKIPFFTLLPLYFAVGLSIQIFTSFLVGTMIISPLVPILTTICSVVALCLSVRKTKKNFSCGKEPINRFVNFFAIILLAILFIYFAQIPIKTGWPSNGDPITTGMLTSLTIYQGHVPTDLNPIFPHSLAYPTGYHVYSANISLLLNLVPGEAIFVLATYVIILISSLLFTLSYVLTKSCWLSLPAAFSVFIIHSSQNLESYLVGYIFNGVFPNLFGFMALITIITLMEISYDKKQQLFRISTILIIMVITLFFTYPVFGFHAVLFIMCYIIFHREKFELRRIDISAKKVNNFLSDIIKSKVQFPQIDGNMQSDGIGIHSYNKLFIHKANLVVLGIFVIVSVLGGLLEYYHDLVFSNIRYFEEYANDFGVDARFLPFISDRFYSGLLMLATVTSFGVMIIKWKPIPLITGFLLLLIILLAEFLFVSPQRTLVFLSLLSWIIIAYTISELKPKKIQKSKIIGYSIIFFFTLTALYLELPHIVNLATENPGWFLYSWNSGFRSNYDVSIWLKNNVNPTDLILNDRTYSSLFVHSFAILNLSHSYWSVYLEPMPQELSTVWNNPYDKEHIHSMLKKYNVRYMLLMDEAGYLDSVHWGGTNMYVNKPYSNQQYEQIFNTYEFLELKYRNGNALVYFIR